MIFAPPVAVILPFRIAVVVVMEVAEVVVRVGIVIFGVHELVVNILSAPYPVPALFVAKLL